MLEEHEATELYAALHEATRRAKQYREETQVSLEDTPLDMLFQPALDIYEQVTGFRETRYERLYHHVVAEYGPPCRSCGRPLRTPTAKLCASCMAPREAV